jgi:hypothetical protein
VDFVRENFSLIILAIIFISVVPIGIGRLLEWRKGREEKKAEKN